MEKESYGYTFEFGRGHNYSINDIADMFDIEPKFTPDYAYLSSTSESWCEHAKKFSIALNDNISKYEKKYEEIKDFNELPKFPLDVNSQQTK